VTSTGDKESESEREGEKLKHRASKRTKTRIVSRYGDITDITHNGIEMDEELNNSLILVHQNMGLCQLSSLKTKQYSQTALHIFHQNIRGLRHKRNELMCRLES